MATKLAHNGFAAKPDSAKADKAYRVELALLLERVEKASCHYEVLGLDESAAYEQVVRAYYTAVSLLYPPYATRASVAEETRERMDRAFSKMSWAFATLADFKKRGEYQALVLAEANGAPTTPASAGKHDARATLEAVRQARHAVMASTTPVWPAPSARDEKAPDPDGVLQLRIPSSLKTVYNEFKGEKPDDNRRRSQRFRLSLPARLQGCDRGGRKWSEMTQSLDVCRTGVTLKMRHPVRSGMVIYLTIPLPTKLRSHGFAEPTFNTYALVRRVDPPRKGERIVAIEFIGQNPPTGYLEKPWAIFKPHQWKGKERRRPARQSRSEKVQVEYFTDSFQSLGNEEALTENISQQGMRIRVARAPVEFDLVRVTCPALHFESLALIRNRYVTKDRGEKLCLQFISNRQGGE